MSYNALINYIFYKHKSEKTFIKTKIYLFYNEEKHI